MPTTNDITFVDVGSTNLMDSTAKLAWITPMYEILTPVTPPSQSAQYIKNVMMLVGLMMISIVMI